MTKNILILLLTFSWTILSGQDQDTLLFHLKVNSGKKSKTFKRNTDLDIYTGDTAFVCGDLLFRNKTTVYLRPVGQTFSNGSFKTYPEKTDSVISIDLNKITSISKHRKVLPIVAGVSFFAFAGTALIVSPLLSIDKVNGFQTRRSLKISGASLGGAIVSLVIIGTALDRHFYIKTNSKKKRTWTLEE